MLNLKVSSGKEFKTVSVKEAVSLAKTGQQVNVFGPMAELVQVRPAFITSGIEVSDLLVSKGGNPYLQLAPSGVTVASILKELQG